MGVGITGGGTPKDRQTDLRAKTERRIQRVGRTQSIRRNRAVKDAVAGADRGLVTARRIKGDAEARLPVVQRGVAPECLRNGREAGRLCEID